MTFRIGHKNARHFYPEPRGGVPVTFARNFAAGPPSDTLVVGGDGTQIPWSVIDSGAPMGPDVPITPQSTGVIRVTSVVVVQNISTDPAIEGIVQLDVQVNGVSIGIPVAEQFTITINGLKSIQIVAETSALPIGVTSNIQVLTTLVDGALRVIEGSSTVEVQEVSVATG